MAPTLYRRGVTPSADTVYRGLRTAYLALCDAMSCDPLVRVGDEPDLAWGMTPVPLLDLNRVTGIRLAADSADGRLAALDHRYRSAGVAPSWWIDPSAAPIDIGARLAHLGYAPLPDLVPAMASPWHACHHRWRRTGCSCRSRPMLPRSSGPNGCSPRDMA